MACIPEQPKEHPCLERVRKCYNYSSFYENHLTIILRKKKPSFVLPVIPTSVSSNEAANITSLIHASTVSREYITFLRDMFLKSQELYDNGYPVELFHPQGTIIFINIWKQGVGPMPNLVTPKLPLPSVEWKQQTERQCCRCHRHYLVDTETADYIRTESCYYHWGKKCNEPDRQERVWTCCQAVESAPGCTEAPGHVCSGVNFGVNGPFYQFKRFAPNAALEEEDIDGIFAIDCEMVFTRYGLELARVTLIAIDSKIAYDSYVRPENVVIDLNTRFSGITEEHLANTTKTLLDVQKDLANYIHAQTVLIGHSLESDLKAMCIMHNRVIDTSVLYPHHLGYPYRISLKKLAQRHLNKIIQEGSHDSIEDAQIVIKLILERLDDCYLISKLPILCKKETEEKKPLEKTMI